MLRVAAGRDGAAGHADVTELLDEFPGKIGGYQAIAPTRLAGMSDQ
jgi:hypothetical protein